MIGLLARQGGQPPAQGDETRQLPLRPGTGQGRGQGFEPLQRRLPIRSRHQKARHASLLAGEVLYLPLLGL